MNTAAYLVNNEALTWGFVAFIAVAFAVWAVVVVKTTNRRWEHDLPLLTDHAQWCESRDWRAQPGTDTERCAGCGTCRSRTRTHPHCATWGHKYRAHQTVWMCGVCGDRTPREALEYRDEWTS